MENDRKKVSVLLAEDNDVIRAFFKRKMQQLDLQVVDVQDGAQGIEAFDGAEFDLIVTDMRMPITDGFALYEHIRERNPTVPFVMMSGIVTPELLIQMKGMTFTHICDKIDEAEIINLIKLEVDKVRGA